jgi:DNA-binding transcriptional LysR family regulator
MSRANREPEDSIGRRVRLRDLQFLSTVVQWGSMAKAAAHLGISQPSISEAIANLEGTLGVRLLDRSPRGIEPTIYATALLKRGLVIFDELRQGISDVQFLSDPTIGDVRIGCPETLTAGFLPAIIDQLSRRYPQIVVHVIHADSATLEFRELRERRIDLMLGRIVGPGPMADDELQAEVLFEERYFVVAGAANPWARRRKVSLAELVDEPWIHMPPDNALSSLIAEAFRSQGLDLPKESVSSFSMHLRIHLLATGRFLTIMPHSMLRFNAEPWSLKALPIDLGIRRRLGAIITLKHRMLSPVAQLFIDHAREIAKLMSTGTKSPHRVTRSKGSP